VTREQHEIIADARAKPGRLNRWEGRFISRMAHRPPNYEMSKGECRVLKKISQKLHRI